MREDFKSAVLSVDREFIKRKPLEVLQVNLGDMCNQRCMHCHVNASPSGDKIMPRVIMEDVIHFTAKRSELVLDITGGCPELNPNFRYFIDGIKQLTKFIKVRNNLTILFEPNMDWLPEFYKENKIKLVCSLPCYTKENVDKQRGEGVFEKSIKALNILNDIGYGKDKDLQLDLVYNPGGAFLPADQSALQDDYRKNLKMYGIVFNNLITITNAPINRFKQFLDSGGKFDEYMSLLIEKFNPSTTPEIMCRTLLSVGWDGILYDCDFNQTLGLSMRDRSGKIMDIKNLANADIEGKEIIFENHCYCCTAGAGSSCTGALDARKG